MKPKCGYPGCCDDGYIPFALVPLCSPHYLIILHETRQYYDGAIDRWADRRHYHMISDRIPWRNHNLKKQRAGRKSDG